MTNRWDTFDIDKFFKETDELAELIEREEAKLWAKETKKRLEPEKSLRDA